MSDEMERLAQWFGENTQVIGVDTAIQAKDRLNFGERNRIKERAAFLLAQKMIDAGVVATTVLRVPQGDVIRVQVQCVRPEVWCEAHQKVFEEAPAPESV